MDLELTDRVALVTGGSRGIGKATARRLALEGCDVAICGRTEGPLREAAEELSRETGRKVLPFVCDITDAESIKRFVASAADSLGGVHIVVNNAVGPRRRGGTVETAVDSDVIEDFEEKVVCYLRVVQAAVPHMKGAGWGRVINISGGINGMPGDAISGPVREIGVIAMTKSMSSALGQYGITVNCVTPGATLTEDALARHQETAGREGIPLDQVFDRVCNRTAIKHVITADEIANVIVFL